MFSIILVVLGINDDTCVCKYIYMRVIACYIDDDMFGLFRCENNVTNLLLNITTLERKII